jgi:hypothetical protein
MEDSGVNIQCPEDSGTADAKQEFLSNTQSVVTAIQPGC